MSSEVTYSFVVPAYNEEQNIPKLYSRIVSLMENIDDKWEIIVVNDGSYDNTLNVLKEFAVKDKRFKYINLSRNFGHQAALSTGLMYISGKAVISMDCDLQDPPEVIEEMIKKWKEGFEIVYARRKNYRKDNFIKNIATKIYYRLMDKVSSIKIPQNVGDFRIVDRKVQDVMNRMTERNRYLRGMVAWTGFKYTFVDYYRPDREDGRSGYSLFKLFKLAMSGIVNFSSIPLKIGLYLGIMSIITGSFLLIYQLVDYIINNAYYHLYKWLVVVLFIFMGFLFMLMWILGEYVGLIYDEVRSRPVSVIQDKVNFDENTGS